MNNNHFRLAQSIIILVLRCFRSDFLGLALEEKYINELMCYLIQGNNGFLPELIQ